MKVKTLIWRYRICSVLLSSTSSPLFHTVSTTLTTFLRIQNAIEIIFPNQTSFFITNCKAVIWVFSDIVYWISKNDFVFCYSDMLLLTFLYFFIKFSIILYLHFKDFNLKMHISDMNMMNMNQKKHLHLKLIPHALERNNRYVGFSNNWIQF